jgi:hypothetical protein
MILKLLIGFLGMDFSDPCAYELHFDLEDVLQRYAVDKADGDAIFEVGEMLDGNGNIDVKDRLVFGQKMELRHVELFSKAVEMYHGWCRVAREACVAWVLIAKRMGVNKDVRVVIAKMVWEVRRETRIMISGES